MDSNPLATGVQDYVDHISTFANCVEKTVIIKGKSVYNVVLDDKILAG